MDVVRARKSDTDGSRRRTSGLLRVLAGLNVREDDLKNGVRRGYLMPPGPDGTWSDAAVVRAKRCFRLRARGARGPTLKMLLYLADGYGWPGIRSICIEGFKRVTALSLLGVEAHTKSGRSLDACIPDIVEYQDDTMSRKLGPDKLTKPTSEEVTRFSVGLLHTGAPLEGGSMRRLMAPLLRMLHPKMSSFWVDMFCRVFDLISGLMGLSVPQQISRLESATTEQIEAARKSLLENVWLIRRIGRKAAGTAAAKGQSFNILTGFGYAKEIDLAPLSINDINITPKFMLGGCIGGFLSISMAFRAFVESWEHLLPSLAIFAKGFLEKLPPSMTEG